MNEMTVTVGLCECGSRYEITSALIEDEDGAVECVCTGCGHVLLVFVEFEDGVEP